MAHRSWLSVAILATAVGLLGAAGRSDASPLKTGGTLLVNLPRTDIDDIDPSIAYGTTTWAIEHSTALKLMTYSDAPAPVGSRLVPEGASAFRASRDGRTYTFTISPGFRFSDGRRVSAANYAFAINRALDRNLQSPAYQFVADVVGAQAVRNGRARRASGVRVRGNRLIVTLTKPDGTFLSKLATPFFQALPVDLPCGEKVVVVDRAFPLPSAGPYYVFHRSTNRLVVLKRNPYYRGSRPRRLAAAVLPREPTSTPRGGPDQGQPGRPSELRRGPDEPCRPDARPAALRPWGGRSRIRACRALPRSSVEVRELHRNEHEESPLSP
jgi:ABC-type oligopeptide transport system substrate-binding subunit